MRGVEFFASLAIVAAVLMGAPASHAANAAEYELRIERQPLGEALQEFSKQSGVQVVFLSKITDGLAAPEVKGRFTVAEALRRLLVSSELTFREINSRTIEVQRVADAASAPKEERGMFVQRARLAQAGSLATGSADTQAQSSDSNAAKDSQPTASADTSIDEVIVTAQKRTERLQEVPVPVTVVTGESLVSSNQLRLQDYFSRIPGLSLTTQDANGQGSPNIVIRGIGLGNAASTVGIVIDDVPYTSAPGLGNALDMDPGDLAQVEVLRGPQGTLYGANSIGGLLKYVSVDPSTEAISGRVEAGMNTVTNGDSPGYSARASVNLPVGDTFAVRLGGFTRRDAGYVDNVQTGHEGVNWGRGNGGRLSALWRPMDNLSIKLSAAVQDYSTHGASFVDMQPGLDDLQQSRILDTGALQSKVEAYSGAVLATFGNVTLNSLTGYSRTSSEGSFDYAILGGLTEAIWGAGITGTPSYEQRNSHIFSQELRLSGPLGRALNWTVGAFYSEEKRRGAQQLLAVDSVTVQSVGTSFDAIYGGTNEEYAAFANLTWTISDRFDVQIGGREGRYNLKGISDFYAGPLSQILFNADPFIGDPTQTKDGAFTYLVTPRFKVAPNMMVYARFASGYRPGSANNNRVPGVPREVAPDTTENYDLGLKGTFLDGRLSVDSAVYYIDWQDIPVGILSDLCGCFYTANAGKAKSRGLELTVELRPLTGMTIAAWGAWNDAELTDIPSVTSFPGRVGDRLPYNSRFSGNLSIDQTFPITGTVTGFAGATLSYVGEREGTFTGNALRQEYPAYAKTDLLAGVKFGDWTARVFANNVTDKRGILQGGVGTFNPGAFYFIPPRTIGLSVERVF